MNKNTFPRLSFLFLLLTIICSFFYSCESEHSEVLDSKIKKALRDDNTIDEKEWNELTSYIADSKEVFPELINDAGEINNKKLYSIILNKVKRRKDSQDIKIFKPVDKEESVTNISPTLKKVNFYLENSSSMNGYLEGENFRRNLRRLTRSSDKYTMDSYLINLEVVPEKDIWKRIQNKNIETKIRDSDTGFILKTAIENQSDTEISIVVTDGIYSARNIDSADILDVDIEKNVRDPISEDNFDTVMIKCSSKFKGTYYVEDSSCTGKKTFKLDQNRPYYIFIFGKPELVNDFLNKGVAIEDLDGFTNILRFNTQKNIKPLFTILSKGDEKKGSFGSSSKRFGIRHEIIEAEVKSGSSSNEFQFSVAVNYSSLKSLDENYLTDKENYTIQSDYPYKIIKIEPIKNISSKAENEIEKYVNKGHLFTHFIVLRAKKSAISGEINIILNKKIPDWVKEVGLKSDCIENIKDNKDQTFTIDKTINGLLEAYDYNKNKNYYSIKLTVKI